MNIGNRIICDQDGEIIAQWGEMSGDAIPRKELTQLHVVELDYGQVDYKTHRIVRIDTETLQPVLEENEEVTE